VGCGGGNGGVFPGGARLPRLPPPHSQQRNLVWGAWAFLCVCELWHSPLREASPPLNNPRLGLIFQCSQRVSQPTAKPRPEKSPEFSPRALRQLRSAQLVVAGLFRDVLASGYSPGFLYHVTTMAFPSGVLRNICNSFTGS